MRERLGILFLHHDVNDIVLNNLQSIREHNPDAVIETISTGEALPNGYSIDFTPEVKARHSIMPKRSSDWIVCSWFLQRKEKCEKWWIVEWDTFCRTSVQNYYMPVWHFPFVASNVRLPYREPKWEWFRKLVDMPKEYLPYLIGAPPFLYLISDEALAAICSELLKKPLDFCFGNGELRFATIANKCGFAPCAYSPPNDQITWINWGTLSGVKTIFHPVKHYVNR